MFAALFAATLIAASSPRAYTVDDSIEISSFVTRSPIDAPDAKHFVIVTERGVVATNRTESKILLFDRRSVEDFVTHRSAARPIPRTLATMSATSNLPVVSDVRWLDARHVAFLGKDGTPYQQLFTADIESGKVMPLTNPDRSVSAYEIRGDTIAYTTLIVPPPSDRSEALLPVGAKSLQQILHPDPPPIADLDFNDISSYALALHVSDRGNELPVSLRLFPPAWATAPPLSLSPDGKTLITVAPVASVPARWAAFDPWELPEQLRLRPGDSAQTDERNDLKPMQFVAVDLRSGRESPLLDAPAGRSLEYFAPLRIFWLSNARVIVTNTFLPDRTDQPYAAVVDLQSHTVQPIAGLRTPPRKAADYYEIEDIAWDAAKEMLTITHAARGGATPSPPEVFVLRSGAWVKVPPPAPHATSRQIALSVDERFDRPPLFVGRVGSAPPVTIFDPNPQLASIALGTVRLEEWKDREGREWKALLALPPDFDPQRRYPLVIQTHGVQLDRFFTDGIFTTGMPGRALVARGFVVLQMPNMPAKFLTPGDGAWNLAAFESAVEHLDRAGLIDPKRVGIIGFSYTCYHVLYALTQRPSLFAAAAITDGNQMSYTQYLYDETGGFYQKYSDATIGGAPWGHLTEWAARSPDFSLDKITAPLLITALERGALLRHWEPYAGLRRLGKTVELLWLRGEAAPHVLVQPRHRKWSQESAIHWFERWLNPPHPSR